MEEDDDYFFELARLIHEDIGLSVMLISHGTEANS